MKTTAILEFDDYRPDDASQLCFKRRGGGWLSQEDLLERFGKMFAHIADMMDRGDHLTITLEVKPAEKGA